MSNYEFEDIPVEWQCPDCGHMNEDYLDKTTAPLCGGCDTSFADWFEIQSDNISFCDTCATPYPFGGGYLDNGICWQCIDHYVD